MWTALKNLRDKLLALSRLLSELLLPATGESKPCGWLDYEYAYELFSSFFVVWPERIWLRDALLDKDYGIPVAIFRRPTGAQMLVLNDPTNTTLFYSWEGRREKNSRLKADNESFYTHSCLF